MPLRILVFSDGRPGHFHQSDGIVSAIKRVRDVHVEKRDIARRRIMPNWLPRAAVASSLVGPEALLSIIYGIDAQSLPEADLIVSTGGETLAANAAAAKLQGIPNIYSGSLRGVSYKYFSAVMKSSERADNPPNAVVSVKPNDMDPEALGRPVDVPIFNASNPPKLAGLMIGGNSGLFSYRDDEWMQLFDFVKKLSNSWGTTWMISTSRRSGDTVATLAKALSADGDVVREFIDYRSAGPGSLKRIFAAADIAVCTEDSSSMISEAISARLPTVGVCPKAHRFTAREGDYRDFLLSQNWYCSLSIEDLAGGHGLERFSQGMASARPMSENHLDILAGKLKEKLPAILAG